MDTVNADVWRIQYSLWMNLVACCDGGTTKWLQAHNKLNQLGTETKTTDQN